MWQFVSFRYRLLKQARVMLVTGPRGSLLLPLRPGRAGMSLNLPIRCVPTLWFRLYVYAAVPGADVAHVRIA